MVERLWWRSTLGENTFVGRLWWRNHGGETMVEKHPWGKRFSGEALVEKDFDGEAFRWRSTLVEKHSGGWRDIALQSYLGGETMLEKKKVV